MLCDLAKVHTGFGIMPKVTHTTEDEEWGEAGSSKKIHVGKSLTQKGGFASMDRIIERKENQYWIIQVDDFQSWMMSFYKFVGRWQTTEIKENKIQIDYSYHLHSRSILLYPLCFIFGKTFYRVYMKRVLENIRAMVDEREKYLYE